MKLNLHTSKLQYSVFAQSIRQGLTLAIPFLTLGSFALLIRNFPVPAFQTFLETFLGGNLSVLLDILFQISLGSLALVLCATIGLSYGVLTGSDDFYLYPIVALISYVAFCGGIDGQSEYIFAAEWVFTSMCITLLSCILFEKGSALARRIEKLHTIGAEYLFNLTIQNLVPIVLIILLFAVFGFLLRTAFGNSNITNFGAYFFLKLFDGITGDLFGVLLYVFLLHGLWFFGIHGGNTLEAVAQRLFEHGIVINQDLLLAGNAPTEIFSKTFLDTFVFIGGCGCALSLVLTLCISAKKSHNRKLALVSLPFTLFNISEIVVFGFPVILNPTMLIPFILSPIILALVSTLAMHLSLVPLVTNSVGWTVPILVSGYQATGSMAGSILQLINIGIGVLIYTPFVKYSEKIQTQKFCHAVRAMEQLELEGEKSGTIPRFLSRISPYSYYAKTLALDLKNALKRENLELYYQPQVNADGTLHGAEALLRWKHPITGFISPPFIISLAYESEIINELTYYILEKACMDAKSMDALLSAPLNLSVNISAKQLGSADFLSHTEQIIRKYSYKNIRMVLEITEQTVLETSEPLLENLESLRSCGVQFSMDDFGMGHSSMVSLQEHHFDEVKLDGNLVTQLTVNERSRDIVSGILDLSKSLHYRVIAEYVEGEELRQILLNLGCTIHQGYYYSRPLELVNFLSHISGHENFLPSGAKV